MRAFWNYRDSFELRWLPAANHKDETRLEKFTIDKTP